jgi:hypothetical protein
MRHPHSLKAGRPQGRHAGWKGTCLFAGGEAAQLQPGSRPPLPASSAVSAEHPAGNRKQRASAEPGLGGRLLCPPQAAAARPPAPPPPQPARRAAAAPAPHCSCCFAAAKQWVRGRNETESKAQCRGGSVVPSAVAERAAVCTGASQTAAAVRRVSGAIVKHSQAGGSAAHVPKALAGSETRLEREPAAAQEPGKAGLGGRGAHQQAEAPTSSSRSCSLRLTNLRAGTFAGLASAAGLRARSCGHRAARQPGRAVVELKEKNDGRTALGMQRRQGAAAAQLLRTDSLALAAEMRL